MSIRKITGGAVAAVIAVLASASAAVAHITASPGDAAADEYATLEFGVPHGCEGSPTRSVRIRIPDTVPSVTPQRNPLWDLTTREGPKQETELNGETITRGVSEVIWTARQPLPDDQLDILGMSVRLPNAPGETLYFPAIQECEQGAHRWIQIPAEGESAEELEEPAPQVELTAGEEGESEPAAEDGDDGAPTWLAVAALGAGAAGLGAGGTALARTRKRTS